MPEETSKDEKSHLRCKIIIEVLGKPKEHVKKALELYVDKIKNDSELIILKEEFAKPQEKGDLWATFVELEMVIKGLTKLIAFCFDYMPSSIEIIKPEEFKLNKSSIEDLLNDLQARLHDVDMVVKKGRNENEFLKKNLNKSVSNTILLTLATGGKDMKDLSKITGIHDKELQLFLDEMEFKKKVKKENDVYFIVNPDLDHKYQ